MMEDIIQSLRVYLWQMNETKFESIQERSSENHTHYTNIVSTNHTIQIHQMYKYCFHDNDQISHSLLVHRYDDWSERWIIKAKLIDDTNKQHNSPVRRTYMDSIDTLLSSLKQKHEWSDKRSTIISTLAKKLAIVDLDNKKKQDIVSYLAEKVLEELLLIEQTKQLWFDQEFLEIQYALWEKIYGSTE